VKKVCVFILLLIFSYTIIGDFFIFKIAQIHHKRTVKAQIEIGVSQENLVKIIVTEDNISQLNFKEEHEFEYKGMMYDIVKKDSVSEKMTVYYCIADVEETNLLADFEKSLKKETKPTGESDNTAQLLVNLLSKVYLLTHHNFSFYHHFPTQQYQLAYTKEYNSPHLHKIFSPPKQTVY